MLQPKLQRQGTHDAAMDISTAISDLMDARTARAGDHGPQFARLWELATECVSGGKLLRPRLLMGAYDALSGNFHAAPSPRSATLKIAAALEILHFAFLLHDDIIDEDVTRRGEPNLIGRLAEGQASSRRIHWARSSAMLVGDLMISIAHQVFARICVSQDVHLRMLDLLDSAITETVAGEYCDVGLADGFLSPDLPLVLETTRMKTAAYTYELPLKIAAVAAGADLRVEARLGNLGRHLGFAFQLQDDRLGAFGTKGEHGKDEYSDFREGKETGLIAYARLTSVWPSLAPLIGAPELSPAVVATIQQLLVGCGAKQFIDSLIHEQTTSAFKILLHSDGQLPTAFTSFILDLVASLDGRQA